MKERVIKNKTELARLLLICQAIKLSKFSIPNVLGAEKDIFNLIYYGSITLRQIYKEFEKKGAL